MDGRPDTVPGKCLRPVKDTEAVTRQRLRRDKDKKETEKR